MKNSYFVRMAIENIEAACAFLKASEVIEAQKYIADLKKLLGNTEHGLNSVFVKQDEREQNES